MSSIYASAIPLIDDIIVLEKFPGKGGWTFARLPGISQDKKNPFGWRRVKGFIDDVALNQYHLMPIGQGQLFLPVKAAIRKKIGKAEGDAVHVRLFEDHSTLHIPEEFLLCLEEEAHAKETFFNLPAKWQKKVVDQIYSSKNVDLIVERIAFAINKLSEGKVPQ